MNRVHSHNEYAFMLTEQEVWGKKTAVEAT